MHSYVYLSSGCVWNILVLERGRPHFEYVRNRVLTQNKLDSMMQCNNIVITACVSGSHDMIKQLKTVGHSNALILDRAILELLGLEPNAEVQLHIRDGSLIVTPANPRPVDHDRFEDCLSRVVTERRAVLRRLAE